MKTLLTISVLLITISANAQRNMFKVTKGAFNNYYEFGWFYKDQLKYKDDYKKNEVKKIELTNYTQKNTTTSYQYYDQEGRIIKTENFYKKKKYTSEYTYDDANNIIELKYTRTNGGITLSKYTYNDSNLMLSAFTTDEKGKISGKRISYTSDNKILSSQIFKKDTTTPIKELINEYYPEGSKKKTIYKENGKIKYVWEYECSDEGELVKAEKKETKICILKEINAEGNEVVWTREFHKGELRKTKTINSKDGLWISIQHFDKDDELVTEYTRNESGGQVTKSRNKKGEMILTAESILDENKKLIKYTYFNKRWGYTMIYHYKNGLLLTKIIKHKKNLSVQEYTYSS